jgi:hypothetical protein
VLLAIDPGVDTGWSLFLANRLVACGLGDPRHSTAHRIKDIATVVVEKPYYYPGSPVNPNDLITLALCAGELAGRYRQWAEIRYVFPFQWKGSVPKAKHHPRILAKLDASELAVLKSARRDAVNPVQKSKEHNVLDSVGLGLFGVGR